MTSTPNYDRWVTSRRFWMDTLERVIRTMAQTALAVFGLSAVGSTNALDLGAMSSLSIRDSLVTVAVTGVFTLVTCLAGKATGDTSTASLTSGTGK